MNIILRIYAWFEFVRMIIWTGLFFYVAFLFDVPPGKENEGFMIIHIFSFCLGFPYSILYMYAPGELHQFARVNYLSAALFGFIIWAVCVLVLFAFMMLGTRYLSYLGRSDGRRRR